MMIIVMLAVAVAAAEPVYGAQDRPPEAAATGPSSSIQSSPVWDEISNYRGWPLKSLEITGLDNALRKELKKGLQLAENDAVLYERALARDIRRIRLFLARTGYPYSTVRIEIRPQRKKIILEMAVDTGPPVVVEDVEISGMPGRFMEKARECITMDEGSVFSDRALDEDEKALLEILMDGGYARASSSSSVRMTDTTHVTVVYEFSPGSVYYFDSFRADGASDDLNRLALIALNVKKGERYSPGTMNDARDNLSALQLFRQIRISLEDTAPDSLEMVIELSEKKHRTFEIAGGYWSDNGFSVRTRWRHSNLFKRGRGSSIELSYTQYKQTGQWVTWWPALFSARLLGTLRVGLDNISEDSYEKIAPGVGIGLSAAHTRTIKSSVGFVVERASYDIKTEEREYFEDLDGLLGFFFYRFIRDGTDDRIDPRKGLYSSLKIEYGPEGGASNSNYFAVQLDNTLHIPVSGKTGFALNLRLGSGTPIAPSTVLLPDKRFYAGGSTTHRGFKRRKLGPLDENGLPLGGELMMTSFVEFRFPLVWKLNGAIFVDAGQVWRTRNDFTWDNIEIAVGPAVRIMTPVGPIRFDLGIRLTDYEPDQPDLVFHFAIGYPM